MLASIEDLVICALAAYVIARGKFSSKYHFLGISLIDSAHLSLVEHNIQKKLANLVRVGLDLEVFYFFDVQKLNIDINQQKLKKFLGSSKYICTIHTGILILLHN